MFTFFWAVAGALLTFDIHEHLPCCHNPILPLRGMRCRWELFQTSGPCLHIHPIVSVGCCWMPPKHTLSPADLCLATITETSDEVNRAGGWRYVVPLSSLVVEPDIEHHTVYTYSVDFSAPRPGGEIEDDMDSTTHQIRTLCNPSLPCIVVMGNY